MIVTVADSNGNWTDLAIGNCQRCHGICSLTTSCRHLLCKDFVKSPYEAVNVWLCNADCCGSCEVCTRIVGMVSTKAREAVSSYFLLCTTSDNSVSTEQWQLVTLLKDGLRLLNNCLKSCIMNRAQFTKFYQPGSES